MSHTDTLHVMNAWTTKNIERMNRLGELNLRMFEKLAERQMDALGLCFDQTTQLAKLSGESKGVNDFFNGQVEINRQFGERLIDEGKTNMKLFSQARDDYRDWLESSLSEIGSDIRKDVHGA